MKRLFVLILALLCLTSCASMLEREATYTAPHVENLPASLADSYRVNTYSGLYSALVTYVEEGMTEGDLRFPATYPGNLAVDLEKAKRQLMEETAVGCYTLSDVTFHVNRIIAYYEVAATFDYRVDPAEYRALETVYSSSYRALNEHLQAAMENFSGGSFTLRWEDCPVEDDYDYDLVAERLRRFYDDSPELAVAYPDLEVTYYPEKGAQRVAEVKVTYPQSATTLRLRQRNMLRGAEELAGELDDPAADDAQSVFQFLLAAYDLVMERFQYDREGGGTAADALQNGSASDEGLARLWQLICHLKGVEHGIFGEQEGSRGYTAVIPLPEGAATSLYFKPYADQGGESQ